MSGAARTAPSVRPPLPPNFPKDLSETDDITIGEDEIQLLNGWGTNSGYENLAENVHAVGEVSFRKSSQV